MKSQESPVGESNKSVRRFKNRVTPEGACLLECKPGDDADFVPASDYDALQAERDALKAAFDDRCRVIEMQLADKDALQSQLDRETQRLASLTQQRDGLREALELYGEHKHNCMVGHYSPSTGGPHDCECGLDAALTPAQEAQT
jgi:hypothetical protein